MRTLFFLTAVLFAGAAYAVPIDWVLVHTDKSGSYYTSPVCMTKACAVREADDIAFLAADIDGPDSDED